MTTTLDRPVARQTIARCGDRRQLIITLYPGDVMGLRPKQTRKEYTIALSAVYSLAVKMHLAALRAEKAKARKAKKETKR